MVKYFSIILALVLFSCHKPYNKKEKGVTETDIKKVTGHQSTSIVQRYIQDAELFDNATKKLDL